MTKIKTKLLLVAETATLLYAITEDISQCRIQDMRHGMVRRNIASSVVVNLTFHRGTNRDFTLLDHTAVKDEAAVYLNIRHSKAASIDGDNSQVSFLSTSFSVERGLVEDEANTLTGLDGRSIGDESIRSKNYLDGRIGIDIPFVFGVINGSLDAIVGQPCRLLGNKLKSLGTSGLGSLSGIP